MTHTKIKKTSDMFTDRGKRLASHILFIAAVFFALFQGAQVAKHQKIEKAILKDKASQLRRAQLIVESSPSAIIMCDENGTITLSNLSARYLFGWPHDELIGRKSTVLIPEEYRDQHVAGMKRSADFIRQYEGDWYATRTGMEIIGLCRDGSLLRMTTDVKVIKYGNGTIEFIIYMRKLPSAPPRNELQPIPDTIVEEVTCLPLTIPLQDNWAIDESSE